MNDKSISFLIDKSSFISLMLSHHPDCARFKGHTIKIGKHRFCIGCFVGYPSAIIGIFALLTLNLIMVSSETFFLIGFTLLFSFILSPFKLTKVKAVKIVQKILIGFGSSFLFWGVWTSPNSFLINLFFFFIVFGVLLALLNLYHFYSLFKTCKKCEFSFSWSECPRFEKIRNTV